MMATPLSSFSSVSTTSPVDQHQFWEIDESAQSFGGAEKREINEKPYGRPETLSTVLFFSSTFFDNSSLGVFQFNAKLSVHSRLLKISPLEFLRKLGVLSFYARCSGQVVIDATKNNLVYVSLNCIMRLYFAFNIYTASKWRHYFEKTAYIV